MDIMIDIETCGTGVDACILTIAAQCFDPLERTAEYSDRWYYARVDPDSQPDRNISDGTIEWWATQPKAAQEEAFSPEGRIPLKQALEELHRLTWQCKRTWANGPTFDMNILEHAYKSYNMVLPWQYYMVRDSRTVFSLWPDQPLPPTTHHALEDCRRQIGMLQNTLRHLRVQELK